MIRLSRIAAALALAAVSATSFAAPVTYEIESTHTFPRFSYSHFGLSTQLSRFDKTSGKVVLDRAARTASVDIAIDLKSVSTGFGVLDEELRGEDYFDTAKFPNATFKSTSVKFDGDKPVSIDGVLTIKGIAKPVTLAVTSFTAMDHPMMKKPAIGANATTTVKRSEFGAGKYVPYVGDDVRIDIAIEAVAP